MNNESQTEYEINFRPVENTYLSVIDTTRIAPTPFCISFYWNGESKTITLKNGEDVFKLADVFENLLDQNGIEYTVENKNNHNEFN